MRQREIEIAREVADRSVSGEIDHRERSLQIVQMALVQLAKSRCLSVSTGGTMGSCDTSLIADTRFEVAETRLKPGDLCCLYTDGVPDAQNQAHEPFRHAPLLDVLSNAGHRTAEEIGLDIEARLTDFGKGAHQVDDMTLLLLRVQELAQDALPGAKGGGGADDGGYPSS